MKLTATAILREIKHRDHVCEPPAMVTFKVLWPDKTFRLEVPLTTFDQVAEALDSFNGEFTITIEKRAAPVDSE